MIMPRFVPLFMCKITQNVMGELRDNCERVRPIALEQETIA